MGLVTRVRSFGAAVLNRAELQPFGHRRAAPMPHAPLHRQLLEQRHFLGTEQGEKKNFHLIRFVWEQPSRLACWQCRSGQPDNQRLWAAASGSGGATTSLNLILPFKAFSSASPLTPSQRAWGCLCTFGAALHPLPGEQVHPLSTAHFSKALREWLFCTKQAFLQGEGHIISSPGSSESFGLQRTHLFITPDMF